MEYSVISRIEGHTTVVLNFVQQLFQVVLCRKELHKGLLSIQPEEKYFLKYEASLWTPSEDFVSTINSVHCWLAPNCPATRLVQTD
jgi:hypothetical protein